MARSTGYLFVLLGIFLTVVVGPPVAGAIESLGWRETSAGSDKIDAGDDIAQVLGLEWGLPRPIHPMPPIWERVATGDTRDCNLRTRANLDFTRHPDREISDISVAIILQEQHVDRMRADLIVAEEFSRLPSMWLGALRACINNSVFSSYCVSYALRKIEAAPDIKRKIHDAFVKEAKRADAGSCLLLDALDRAKLLPQK